MGAAMPQRVAAAQPYFLNAAVGATVGMTGDAAAQRFFSDRNEGHNWNRTLEITGFALLMYPCLYRWQSFLEVTFGASKKFDRTLVKKLALDQLLWAPLVNGSYLCYSARTQRRDVRETMEDRFVPVMLADWCVWPAAMSIGFTCVPFALRTAYCACVGTCWQTFLSGMSHAYGKEVTEIMSVTDSDNDGELTAVEMEQNLMRSSYSEFSIWMLKNGGKNFAKFDTNQNGTIDIAELDQAARVFKRKKEHLRDRTNE